MPEQKLPPEAARMIRDVGAAQERIERGRGQKNNILGSIAILGVVGWSVTLPTILGVVLGVWMDRRWPGRFSWALTLMMLGLAIGCTSAWFRIKGDHR
jgi:ATP synthase protein I